MILALIPNASALIPANKIIFKAYTMVLFTCIFGTVATFLPVFFFPSFSVSFQQSFDLLKLILVLGICSFVLASFFASLLAAAVWTTKSHSFEANAVHARTLGVLTIATTTESLRLILSTESSVVLWLW